MSIDATLTHLTGSHHGKKIALEVDDVVIGRSSLCTVRLNDPRISRQHVRLRFRGNAAILIDLSARTGTFLNGKRVRGWSKLKPGDIIKVGPEVFRFGEPVAPPKVEVVSKESVRTKVARAFGRKRAPTAIQQPKTTPERRPGCTQSLSQPPKVRRKKIEWLTFIVLSALGILGGHLISRFLNY